MSARTIATIAILTFISFADFLGAANPLSLGTTYSGTISVPGQAHTFTFTGSPGQILYFDAQDSDNLNIGVAILSPEGVSLYSGNDDYDYGPFVLAEAGTYSVVIDGYGAATGSYQFRLLDLSAASVLPLGTRFLDQVNPPQACRIYKFAGVAGQRIQLQSVGYSSSQMQWKLVSPANVTLASNPIYQSLGIVTLPLTGDYYVLVSGGAAGVTPLQFQIEVDVLPEPAATVAGFGVVQSGTVNANQTNTFTYTAPAGLPVFFDSQDASGQPLIVELIDPSSNSVFTVGEVFDAGPYILPRSGTYKLNVRAPGGASANFQFRLLDLTASQTLPLNTTVSNVFSNPYQTEVYQFAGTAGQRLYYDAIDNDFDNVNFYLRSPDGQTPIAANADSDRGPLTLLNGGTYYVFVQSGLPTTPNYTFQLFDIATRPPLPLNTDFTGTVPANAATLYRLAGTSGQHLFFNGKWTSAGGYWTLYGPNDAYVGQASLGSDFEVTLPAAGNYVMVLNAAGTDVSFTNQVNTFTYTTNTLTLGSAATNAILNPGDIVFYTFAGAAGQRLFFDPLNASYFQIYATMIAPSGATLFSGNASSDRGPVTLPETGTYTLALDGSGDTTGQFSFQLLDTGVQSTLPLNVDFTGTIAANASTIYRLPGNTGQRLYFNGKWTSAGGAYWTLYAPNDAYVSQAALTGDFEVTIAAAGTYLLVLSGAGTDVSYTNQVNVFSYVTNALTLGTAVTNTIVNPGDAVIYTFTGTAGQRIYYDALNASYLPISLTLFAPHGVSLFSINASSDRGPLTLTESGTYTLIFDGSGDTTGKFSFQLLDVGAQAVLPLNVDLTGALQPFTSTIYRINGAPGQQLYFDGKGVSAGGGYWVLYGPNDAYLSQAGLGGDFEVTLANGGTHVLVLSADVNAVNYTNQLNTYTVTTNALTLGAVTGSTVVRPGDILLYTFNGTAGQRVFYDPLNTNYLAINVTLVTPQGATVFSGNATSDRGPLTLLESGTYTLVIDGSVDTTGTINFQLLDLAAAAAVSPGSSINDSLSSQTQTKAYRFTGTAGQRLNLQSLSASGNQAYWELIGPADQVLGSVPNISGNIGTVTLPAAGTYTVLVVGNGSIASPVSYQLGLADVSDAPASASGFGTVHSGNISANQTNKFTYTAPAGLPVFYDSQDTSGQSLAVDLIDPAGNLVFTVNETGDVGPYVLPRSGSYSLNVRSVGGGSGNYSFRLLDLSASPTLPLNTVVSNLLSNPYETDAYQFTAAAGQRLFYDAVMDDPNYPSVYVTLVDPRALAIAPNGPFSSDYGPFMAQYGGTFYLFTRNTRDTARSLAFRLLDVATQPALPLNVAVTNNLPSYQTVMYRYAGTAGQRLYFMGQGSNPSGFWQLYSPNNSPVSLGSAGLAGDFEVTLPVTGSYALVLATYGAPFGTNVFQVNDFTYATNTFTIGSTVSDSINRPGEQKVYTFSGTLGQRLYYDALTNDLNYPIALVTLLNPQGQHVEGPSGAFVNDFGPFTLLQSGTYSLVIDGNLGRTGPYAFRLLDVGAQPVLPINIAVTNTLQSYPSLVYRYAGTAGQHLYFRGNGSNPSGSWTLFDPNNNTVSSGSAPLAGDFEITLPMDGSYALVLYTYNGNAGTSIFQVNDYAYVTNAYTIGSVVRDAISRPGEQKAYTFTGTQGQRLYYDALTNDLNYPTAVVTLLNPQGQHVEGPSSGFVYDSSPFTLQQSGVYTLLIDGYAARTGPVAFRLLDLSSQPALPINVAVTNALQSFPAAQYQYADTAGQRLYFRAQAGNPSGFWTLYDPNNSIVTGGNSSLTGDLEVTLPVSGTYALVLGTYNETAGTNVFQVNPFNFGETFSINRAPLLTLIPDQNIGEGDTLTFTAAATDPDGNAFSFSLDAGGPTAASIGAASGVFNWTPPFTGFSYVTNFTIRVTDNGSPSLSAAQTFAVKVVSGPVIIRATKTATNVTVLWRSAPGEHYRLQSRDNLSTALWTDVVGTDTIATNFSASASDTSFGTNSQRYYRVQFFPAP